MKSNYEVVKNMNTLKSMEKKGLVKFHYQTGEKVYGLWNRTAMTAYYIDECKTFEYKGNTYTQKYFDGCFYPYVVKVLDTTPGWSLR